MSSSIFRRLLSSKIASSPILRRRKFCTAAATEELLRSSSSPYLMLPHSFIGGVGGGRDMVYNFYCPINDKVVSFNNKGGREETKLLQDDKTRLVGSSHGWLALYNSGNHGMCLLNPVSGRCIDLPPLAGQTCLEKAMPVKLIMSCPPDEEECRAVLIFNSGHQVAFCCPGRSRHWTPFGGSHDEQSRIRFDVVSGSFNSRYYLDFVYSASRKRFAVLISDKSFLRKVHDPEAGIWDISEVEVEYWDISEPSCPRMDRVERAGAYDNWINWNGDPSLVYAYMVSVEESGQLFIVAQKRYNNNNNNKDREEGPENHYDVYRVEDGRGLELCSSSLEDDLTVFVGVNHSIASPKLKRNCIYFADILHGKCVEIFDYKKRTRSPLYFPTRRPEGQSHMTWFTPTFE